MPHAKFPNSLLSSKKPKFPAFCHKSREFGPARVVNSLLNAKAVKFPAIFPASRELRAPIAGLS